MKNIHRLKRNFQSFLDSAKFVIQLFFGALPETEIKKSFPMPVNLERLKLQNAVRAFELKKLRRAR